MRRKILPLLATSSLLLITACPSLYVAGATKAGVTMAQDRSVGTAIDDSSIWSGIKESFFRKDLDNLFAKVDVEVHNGRVLLTGVVQKPETRVDATVLAWQPKGVKEVINEIQISDTQSLKDFAQDVAIAAQVRGKLLLEKQVKSVNYTTDCINGVVYLMGIAQDKRELKRVTFIASRVRGVKKVVSHVQIKEEPKASAKS